MGILEHEVEQKALALELRDREAQERIKIQRQLSTLQAEIAALQAKLEVDWQFLLLIEIHIAIVSMQTMPWILCLGLTFCYILIRGVVLRNETHIMDHWKQGHS